MRYPLPYAIPIKLIKRRQRDTHTEFDWKFSKSFAETFNERRVSLVALPLQTVDQIDVPFLIN